MGRTYAIGVRAAVMAATLIYLIFFFGARSFQIHDIRRITDVLNQTERRQNSLECTQR